ncbi:MAG: 2-dehydropantoate 2-reductase [Thiothrix sp.]|nr:2-dehydropantoate 2-reductase [Thiothrix sp.]
MTLRYSILGAGAMGSVFGARLALAGFPVELLNRSPAHGNAIRAQGGLKARIGDRQHLIPLSAVTVAEAGEADVVILFTKSFQIEQALGHLPESLQQAHVVTLQNGLGNGARVAALIGTERTSEGLSMMPSEFLGPGEVASSEAAQTWMYHASGQPHALTEQVGRDFNQAGITTTVTPEVQQHIWQKACFNIAMNALCALTAGSPGLLQQHPDGRALAHEVADEALKVAASAGATPDPDKVHQLIDYACANHPWHKPSMRQDLEQARMTEIDALNGHIVAAAAQAGIPVPLNTLLTRLIRLRQAAPDFWAGQPASH